jgi:hypothetical protein
MHNLNRATKDLPQHEMTRQQFFLMIGGSFFIMIRSVRLLQSIPTPIANDLFRGERGAIK